MGNQLVETVVYDWTRFEPTGDDREYLSVGGNARRVRPLVSRSALSKIVDQVGAPRPTLKPKSKLNARLATTLLLSQCTSDREMIVAGRTTITTRSLLAFILFHRTAASSL